MAGITEDTPMYRRFAAIWADGEPVRSPKELAAALRAAGMDTSRVSDDWLRELRSEWVYGRSDEPFGDQRANRTYRRELMES